MGSGKTTLLSIIGFLDSAWHGEYAFAGQRVEKMNHKERAALHKKYVGFVFQSYHLIDGLTVKENLEVPLSYRDMKRAQSEALVADTLDRFHIVGKKDLYPSQLSGGQQHSSRSRARSYTAPSSYSPTSPQATFTRDRAAKSWSYSSA